MDAFPADIGDVYNHTGYIETQETNYSDNVGYRKKRFAMERLQIITIHLNKPAAGAGLLDVGCGTGWFLETARDEGYEVSGLELGRQLAQYTSQKLGIPVHTLPLTELPAIEQFDVITLFDVLEYASDPCALLKSISDHLNPGGIGLLFTPNLDSVGIALCESLPVL
jgi:2-polyprenyl-3-methyl-5-hydroxy-6-metoxy-1,4-benzoquinol methylase